MAAGAVRALNTPAGSPPPGESQGPAPGLLLGVSLAHGAGRRDILGAGWCDAEPTGTWTGDTEALLCLDVRSDIGGCTLRITAAPYRASQRMLLLSGRHVLGRTQFDEPGAVELAIPRTALTEGGLLLCLVLPDARRPSELGKSGDTRLLGLFVTCIELLHAEARSEWPAAPPCPSVAMVHGPDTPVAVHSDIRPPVPPPRALLEAFESLGWDAEFGFVQRRFLAEPAGLLRWACVGGGAAVLADALTTGLHGIGDPAQLSVEANGDAWVVRHRRWQFAVDTHLPCHDVEPTVLREREACAQAMQRDRLLATLREGRRILVYKERDPADRAAADALAEAIAGHGGCWLLWVSRGTPAIRRTGLRRLEATLPRMAPFDNLGRVAAQDWLELCSDAWRLSRG